MRTKWTGPTKTLEQANPLLRWCGDILQQQWSVTEITSGYSSYGSPIECRTEWRDVPKVDDPPKVELPPLSGWRTEEETKKFFDPANPQNWIDLTCVRRFLYQGGAPIFVELIERRHMVHADSKEGSDRLWGIIIESEANLERVLNEFRKL